MLRMGEETKVIELLGPTCFEMRKNMLAFSSSQPVSRRSLNRQAAPITFKKRGRAGGDASDIRQSPLDMFCRESETFPEKINQLDLRQKESRFVILVLLCIGRLGLRIVSHASLCSTTSVQCF